MAASQGEDTFENLNTIVEVSENSMGDEMERIVSSRSFKTSNAISSTPSTLQELEGDVSNKTLLDLFAEFESKQKHLESLKREFKAVLRDLAAIESKISLSDVGKLGFSKQLSKTIEDAVLHQETVQIQRLIAENGLLRTKLKLAEKSKRDFRNLVESQIEENMKRNIQLNCELDKVKNELEETRKANEELNSKVEKYRSKAREARSSLSDTISRIKSSISACADVETRKNSNFSLNESLLAYWELI
uniref:Vimentin n=1 Tax=Lygus hesperus TaxID=30085 RepID=A0A0A9ZCF4_LYGHE